jgi:hypothetical protein
MRKLLSLISLLFTLTLAQAQGVVITGFAPSYVGKTINASKVLDYFSQAKGLLATTTVRKDSTFTLVFESPDVQKIILTSGNNEGFILVQPNTEYKIYFPEKDKYTPYKPSGNEVEVAFLELDSTDINYKILGFQRWVDHFIGNNYHLKSRDSLLFAKGLDRFKTSVQKYYATDTNVYLKAHIRFTIAGLDNIPNAAERNRYEKYDFYIRNTPVYYNCEAYMTYIGDFYQKLIPRLSIETNQAVYEGVLHSSPSMIMKALATEYTTSNLQIRELVMIKTLSEAFNTGDFPQTNILTILDSLSQRALIKQHREIAKNLTVKLTQLVSGGKAPDMVLIESGKETKTLHNYSGKHVYIQFMDIESLRTEQELPLMKEIHSKYGNYVHFISIYKASELSELDEKQKKLLEQINWDVYGLPESNPIWKKYNIEAFPQYTLIDAAGYVVASPALAPTPNGQYQTIDETFFYLKKVIERDGEGER